MEIGDGQEPNQKDNKGRASTRGYFKNDLKALTPGSGLNSTCISSPTSASLRPTWRMLFQAWRKSCSTFPEIFKGICSCNTRMDRISQEPSLNFWKNWPKKRGKTAGMLEKERKSTRRVHFHQFFH
jgi:hypothetical protein